MSTRGATTKTTRRTRQRSKLRDSQRCFRILASEMEWLMKSMASAFVVWETIFDRQGRLADIRFAYFNDAYERVSGVKLAAVLGKTVREVWPDTEESWFQVYGEVALSGQPKSFEMYHVSTRGYYACTAYRPWDSSDRICVVFEDITERKRTEVALRENEARLRLALAGANQGLFDLNLRTGECVVSPEYLRMLGYEPGEVLVNLGWWREQVHPDDLEMATRTLRECLEGRLSEYRMEYRLRTKDGRWIWVQSLGRVVETDPAGRPLRMLGIHADITERKLGEQALRESEGALRGLFEAAPIGVAMMRERVFRRVNAQICRITGYSEAELVGQPTRCIFSDDAEYDRVGRELYNGLEQQGGRMIETRLRHKNGTDVEVLLGASALGAGGASNGVVTTVVDVTEQKRAEAALRASQRFLNESQRIVHIGSGELDVATDRLTLSDEGYRILGMVPQSIPLTLEWLIDRVNLEDRELFQTRFAEVRTRKCFEPLECRVLRTDGVERWLRLTGEVVCDAAGTPLKLLSTQQDVTELKRVNDALRASESKLAEIFRTSPSFLSISTLAEGRMLAVNDAAVRMMGYAREEILGRTSWEIGLWPTREERERLIRMIGEHGQIQDVEARMCRKSGEVFEVLVSMTPLTLEGQSCLVTGIVDIAKLKRAEEAVRRSEALLRATLDSIDDGVLVVAASRRVSHHNARFLDLWSVPPELANKDDQTLLAHAAPQLVNPGEYLAGVEEICRSQVHTHDTLRFRDGRIFERFSRPVELYGAGVERLWVFRDITERKRAEEELQKLAAVVMHSAELVNLAALDGKMLFLNEAGSRMLGIAPAEVVGRNILEVIPDFLLEKARNEVLPLMTQGGSWEGDLQYRNLKTGALTDVRANVFTISDPGTGRLLYLANVSLDITERKQAEAALRDREARLASIFRAAPIGIGVVANRQVREVNEATCHITGYSRQELVGQSSRLVYASDEDFAAIGALYPQLASLGRVAAETHWRRKDGIRIDVLLNVAPIDPEDPAQGVTFVVVDISERKRAEAALQESEQKFRALFEHMAEGVAIQELVFNQDGCAVDYRVLDVNPAYGRHTGLAPEAARGQLASVLYGTGSAPYLAEWVKVACSGEPHVFETFFAPMQRHFHISAVSPKPGVFATVFEDITERKEREEELRRKNEELERFTYTVSHDLKSPLITIKGFAGALMQDAAAGRLNRLDEDLKRIMSATDKMAALLNDLLELSRIGRLMNPPTEIKLDRLVQEVLELLAGPISQRAVQVVVQPGLPAVQGDRRRLAEVFQNLVENAIRFLGDQPQPRIEIGVRGEGLDRVFFVRDNGIGIEPCYRETVFGLFNKLDARTPGTGIGLALVRRIIEVHGGKVWVESAGAGHGATFCFTLPATPSVRKETPR